jgi:hypothetical protein
MLLVKKTEVLPLLIVSDLSALRIIQAGKVIADSFLVEKVSNMIGTRKG